MPLTETFIKLLNESSAIEDRSGKTELDQFIESLLEFDEHGRQSKLYQVVVELTSRYHELSDDAFSKLGVLLSGEKVLFSNIADLLRRCVESEMQNNADTFKRAVIVRLLSEERIRLAPGILVRDTELKERFPWYWIDSMLYVDKSLAFEYVDQVIEHEKTPTNLMRRIEEFFSVEGESLKNYLIKWRSLLSPSDANRFTRFLSRRQINIPSDMSYGQGLDGLEEFVSKAAQSELIMI